MNSKGKTTMQGTDKTGEVVKIIHHLMRMDILITIALVLIGIAGVRNLISTTRATRALSEVAQKVGVDFPVETNNVLGIWQTIKPR